MGCRALIAVVVLCSFTACSRREYIARTAPHPPIARDGNDWDVSTRSGYQFEGQIAATHPNGDVVVGSSQYIVVPRHDLASISRPRRTRAFLYGFGATLVTSLAFGALSAASYNEDECDVACDPGDRLMVGLSLGLMFGLTVGGPIGAAIGSPESYVYQ